MTVINKYCLCTRLVSGYHRLAVIRAVGVRAYHHHNNPQQKITIPARAFSGRGGSSSDERSVLQSWTDSVLDKDNSRRDGGGGNQSLISENSFFKRPSRQKEALNLESNQGGGEGGRKRVAVSKSGYQPPVYRRRMADQSWTKEPIDDKLIWVDCEMTGLNPESDMIMEIGCIITDSNLKEIAAQPSIIIHVPEEKLTGMGLWCVKHHGDSGLTEACRQSTTMSEDVDNQLLSFVQKYTKVGECPMAGNSIYMDRLFISKQFPKFHSHFHYRNVDVSTFKELVRRWYPSEYSQAPKKKFAHRVLDDIKDSIAELEYYKFNVMKQSTTDAENSNIASEKQNM